jgi:large subunit ribosomal protein L19
MQILDDLDKKSIKEGVVTYNKGIQKQVLIAGDRVKVYVNVVEGSNTRTQIFEGDIIAINGSGVRKTVTVRKQSFGVGVERVFPVNSPNVSKIEVLNHGAVRRAKLYYIREAKGKANKIREKREN